jgi:predicted lipid-binding transport protein (Tim44 family)
MTQAHWTRFLIAGLFAAVVGLAPALAEAQAGRGSSSGSRGSRTSQSAPTTQTAPSARPVERSTTQPGTGAAQAQRPSQATQPGAGAAAQPQGSFFQRNPFVTGLIGGMIGAGIVGMLMGGGFGEGLGSGMAGFLGMALQFALIGGIAYFAYSWFRRRQAGNVGRPAMAGLGPQSGGPDLGGLQRTGLGEPLPSQPAGRDPLADLAQGPGGGAQIGERDEVGLTPDDFNAFEKQLTAIQGAWSQGDISGLRRLVTPEMLSYFSTELSALASRGVENRVEDVKLDQGDLSEAWTEGNVQYATVAMRWSGKIYDVETASGRVVDGDRDGRKEITEVWTFMRSTGGQWILSAIQQV